MAGFWLAQVNVGLARHEMDSIHMQGFVSRLEEIDSLAHIIDEARKRSYNRLSLETGSMQAFQPAHQLYLEYGFTFCHSFADYVEDPHCVFMTRTL